MLREAIGAKELTVIPDGRCSDINAIKNQVIKRQKIPDEMPLLLTKGSVEGGVPGDVLLLVGGKDALAGRRVGQLGPHTPHAVYVLPCHNM